MMCLNDQLIEVFVFTNSAEILCKLSSSVYLWGVVYTKGLINSSLIYSWDILAGC